MGKRGWGGNLEYRLLLDSSMMRHNVPPGIDGIAVAETPQSCQAPLVALLLPERLARLLGRVLHPLQVAGHPCHHVFLARLHGLLRPLAVPPHSCPATLCAGMCQRQRCTSPVLPVLGCNYEFDNVEGEREREREREREISIKVPRSDEIVNSVSN